MGTLLNQAELELLYIEDCVSKFRQGFEKAKADGTVVDTLCGSLLLRNLLTPFADKIDEYLSQYKDGQAVRHGTIAAKIINIAGADVAALITMREIVNSFYKQKSRQSVYKLIGQSIVDEINLRKCRESNSAFYDSLHRDLHSRNASPRYISTVEFLKFKKMGIELETYSIQDKVHTGMLLTEIFKNSTGLIELEDRYIGKKHEKVIIPTQDLVDIISNLNHKLEGLHPVFLPMIEPPERWQNISSGGYKTKGFQTTMVKTNNKEHYKRLKNHTIVQSA